MCAGAAIKMHVPQYFSHLLLFPNILLFFLPVNRLGSTVQLSRGVVAERVTAPPTQSWCWTVFKMEKHNHTGWDLIFILKSRDLSFKIKVIVLFDLIIYFHTKNFILICVLCVLVSVCCYTFHSGLLCERILIYKRMKATSKVSKIYLELMPLKTREK